MDFMRPALWLIVILLLFVLFNLFNSDQLTQVLVDTTYSQFITWIDQGQVQSVKISDSEIIVKKKDSNTIYKVVPVNDPALVESLKIQNVEIIGEPPAEGNWLFSILISWLPMLLLIGVWIFFMRRMQGGGASGLSGFTSSKAKLYPGSTVRFTDVAGCDEAKANVEDIIEFLKEPERFSRLGGRPPRGVLLIGPPGTGKTLLARAIAGEASVPFFTISGSDFVEMFVGAGASRVRSMFEQGRKNAPCIIFIDEIDAVGRKRGAGLGGGHDEKEQTLNQLLVEMDGFSTEEGVILIGATNRPDVLDTALLRPGRFDRQVIVPNPDVTGREQILKVHIRNIKYAPNVDLKVLARGTPGFSGADLANLVNEAALIAAKTGKNLTTMADFEMAKDKVLMGDERRSMVMTEEDKKLTAYHEAGHALVGLYVSENDPLHKVTIIPRGLALGITMSIPERDPLGYKKSQLEAKIAMAYGGREAELLIFGKESVTTGASSDIKVATQYAKIMVTEYGMHENEHLGTLDYTDGNDEVFLGAQIMRSNHISEVTAQAIDKEIRRITRQAEERARKVLTDHEEELHLLAKALLEYETLSGEEVERAIRKEEIRAHEVVETKKNKLKRPVSSIPNSGGSIKTKPSQA